MPPSQSSPRCRCKGRGAACTAADAPCRRPPASSGAADGSRKRRPPSPARGRECPSPPASPFPPAPKRLRSGTTPPYPPSGAVRPSSPSCSPRSGTPFSCRRRNSRTCRGCADAGATENAGRPPPPVRRCADRRGRGASARAPPCRTLRPPRHPSSDRAGCNRRSRLRGRCGCVRLIRQGTGMAASSPDWRCSSRIHALRCG